MSAPFRPGDCVVCVDDRPRGRHETSVIPPIREGDVDRIIWVVIDPDGEWGVKLAMHRPSPGYDGFAAWRFRKIENDTGFDFREQIRAKPVRPVLNPSRHSREMV